VSLESKSKQAQASTEDQEITITIPWPKTATDSKIYVSAIVKCYNSLDELTQLKKSI
jgi:hypothetical protein